MAVDFPDILVDKGQYFGESKPLPLRLWLGGQFYIPDVGMVVGRPIPLKVVKNKDNKWSFKDNHTLYKMAVGAKLIQPGEVFVPQRIDELLGKPLQFEAQVFFKESKGKQYYTEYVAYKTGLGRGQAAPDISSNLITVEFNKQNSEEAIGEIRSHIVNTMKRAGNFEGSVIQKQLAEKGRLGKKVDGEVEKPETPTPTTKPSAKSKPAPKPSQNVNEFEDSIPF